MRAGECKKHMWRSDNNEDRRDLQDDQKGIDTSKNSPYVKRVQSKSLWVSGKRSACGQKRATIHENRLPAPERGVNGEVVADMGVYLDA